MRTIICLTVFLCLNQVAQAGFSETPSFWENFENGDSARITGSSKIVNRLRNLEADCRDQDGKSFFQSSFLISQAMIANPIVEVFAYRQGRLLVVRPYVLNPDEGSSNKSGWDFYCELY